MNYKEFGDASIELAKKVRTIGILAVMVASGAAAAILGTEYWRWDAFTATLASLCGIGVAICTVGEVQIRLYKRFIRKEPS